MKKGFKNNAKNILLFVLYYSGLLTLLKGLLAPKSPVIRIFSYHNISDEKKHLFAGVSVKNFKEQISYLKRHFQIISLGELIKCKKSKSLPKNSAVITFDDGYRNNYQHAYPILLEQKAPATIFLATDYIGTNDMLWTDKLNYMFKHTKANALEIESPALKKKTGKRENEKTRQGLDDSLFPHQSHEKTGNPSKIEMKFKLGNATEKLIALNAVRDILKSVNNKRRDELLTHIEERLGVSENGKYREMLSWEEVREMQGCGITFGAHTQSHPILTHIPIEQARREMQDSKSEIEKRLSCEVICFAYPNGLEKDFNRDIIKILQEAGFQCALTNINGFVHPDDNPFELRRVNEMNKPVHVFAAKVSGIFDNL